MKKVVAAVTAVVASLGLLTGSFLVGRYFGKKAALVNSDEENK